MSRFPDHLPLLARPANYSPDLCPELSLAGRVRGTWRRLQIQRAYDEGHVDALPSRVFEETLTDAEIEALETGDQPQHVGGERLPRLEADDEVKIARINCRAIKKAPVVALYARPMTAKSGYALRFVNEFGREIVDYPRRIGRPLNLGELIQLFNGARLSEGYPPNLVWYLALGCERRGWPVDHLIQGVSPVSAYYPGLNAFTGRRSPPGQSKAGFDRASRTLSPPTQARTVATGLLSLAEWPGLIAAGRSPAPPFVNAG